MTSNAPTILMYGEKGVNLSSHNLFTLLKQIRVGYTSRFKFIHMLHEPHGQPQLTYLCITLECDLKW